MHVGKDDDKQGLLCHLVLEVHNPKDTSSVNPARRYRDNDGHNID